MSPEGHLKDLAQVDRLGFVVISMQHLAKKRVVKATVLPATLWPIAAAVRLQEAGAAIVRQAVLLHAPEGGTVRETEGE